MPKLLKMIATSQLLEKIAYLAIVTIVVENWISKISNMRVSWVV